MESLDEIKARAEAVVPGAKITITNTNTGERREAQSREGGVYEFE